MSAMTLPARPAGQCPTWLLTAPHRECPAGQLRLCWAVVWSHNIWRLRLLGCDDDESKHLPPLGSTYPPWQLTAGSFFPRTGNVRNDSWQHPLLGSVRQVGCLYVSPQIGGHVEGLVTVVTPEKNAILNYRNGKQTIPIDMPTEDFDIPGVFIHHRRVHYQRVKTLRWKKKMWSRPKWV